MLRISMAASLLAMTLSVDAFAGYPDETDETEATTPAHRGPENTLQAEVRNLSRELMQTAFRAHIHLQEQDLEQWRHGEMLKLFKIKSDTEFHSTYKKIEAEYQRRKNEIHHDAETKTKDLTDPRSFRNFEALQRNFVPYEHKPLPSMDLSTLLEETGTE